MAARLASAIERSPLARLAWQPQANEVFAILKKTDAEKIQASGAAFYEWHRPTGFADPFAQDEALYRFVASFATAPHDVDKFAKLIGA
jgi:threonine aldolase